MKLFVIDFDEYTDIAELARQFTRFGTVNSLRMKQGKMRRYAIIEMVWEWEAKRAIEDLDGKDFTVREAQ